MSLQSRICALIGAGMCAVALHGCGHEPERHYNRVELSGTVTYRGNTLPGGTVTVVSKQNHSQIAATSIREDGSFTVPDAPLGDVFISISTDGVHRYQPARVPKLPAKYGNPKSSGFSAVITNNAENVIELKLE